MAHRCRQQRRDCAPATLCPAFFRRPSLPAVWEMFYCRDPYEGLLEGQICVGVTGEGLVTRAVKGMDGWVNRGMLVSNHTHMGQVQQLV